MRNFKHILIIFMLVLLPSCDLFNHDTVSDSNQETVSLSESESIEENKSFNIYSVEMLATYGDASLITYGDYDILIDSGTSKDGATVKELLSSKVIDKTLDLLIISHPDSDHTAGIYSGDALLGLNSIKKVIVNTLEKENNEKVISKVKEISSDATIMYASNLTSSQNRIYSIDVDTDFKIQILYSSYYDKSNNNNASIPTIISYKNTKVFFGGDMEESASNTFIDSYSFMFNESDYVIFKALHHGSKATNKDKFLTGLKPDLCFLSAPLKVESTNNTPNYDNHPYLETINRLKTYTESVYWAGISGTLIITCDGNKASVEGMGRSKDYYYKNADTYTLASRDDEKNITVYNSCYYLATLQ